MTENEHLKFYRSESLDDEIDDSFTFDPVEAGEKVERTIFVENVIDHRIEVDKVVLEEETGSVNLKDTFESIGSEEVKEIVLVFDTELERLNALKVGFSVDYHFVVD